MQRCRDEDLKIKRYGQVFSRKPVGDLLVSMLPDDLSVRTIIDPMAGQGDLLRAAYEKYPKADRIVGLDIDADVMEKCNAIIPEAEIFIKDAFRSEEIEIAGGWDLVITNPPYIRYQTLKTNPEIGLPDGKELRENLINHIKQSRLLNDRDKHLYLEISNNYSGLSDMTVPSWILCASIVKQGGYIAMVVPETWLSRDYALPIHYLLLRCFDIIAIARDVESAWFEDAEVRTCLVVCKRKENDSVENSYSGTMLMEIGSGIKNQDSLIGNMKYEGYTGYEALSQIISAGVKCSFEGFSSRIVPEIELFPGLIGGINKQKWIYKEDKLKDESSAYIPNEIRAIVGRYSNVEYDSLEARGWSVGQGLRTGANDFFYAQVLSEDSMSVVKTEAWYDREIEVSSDNIRKAFKKRADVNGLVVNYEELRKCIFYIQHQVRQTDYQKLSHEVIERFSLMDSGLDDYITNGEKYISPTHKKTFKELSAVITNEKKKGSEFERFWYMLPQLKRRHVPDLCISRVCGESPETMFVNQASEKEIIVDANFITLWNPDHHAQLAAFALLNSTWAKVFLEVTGTAMGGGALKVEASHVRKIVFPRINSKKEYELESIGKIILKNRIIDRKLQRQIDEIAVSPFGDADKVSVNDQLSELLIKKIKERTGRKYDE